jgi:phosphate transport system substrate-binding protein
MPGKEFHIMSETKVKIKKRHPVRNIFLVILAIALVYMAIDRANKEKKERYLGHGFEYMHGWSSTDFTGYHVYDSEKLYKLDHEASLIIENEEDMPVLDGAEACYPVYSAFAKAVYKNIDAIEAEYKKKAEEKQKSRDFDDNDYTLMDVYFNNGKYVSFTNTVQGYDRLINGDVDIMIGARPSQDQKNHATMANEQIVTRPIGKEAFVFFTQASNPVDNLTSDQIRSIYHGDITSWKEVGGKNQKIVAFQRPENSGSQVAMKWFMGDVPLADPKKVEIINVGPMGGIVTEVAQYNDEKGALGYTFKYFLTGLNQEKNVKILSVDGVYPTAENIKNGTYPATVSLVAATLASNDKPYVKKMIDFMLSDDGQEIIEQTGYAGLTDRNVTETVENDLVLKENIFVNEEDDAQFKVYGDAETGNILRFELIYHDSTYKGQINTMYNDGSVVENSFWIYDNGTDFETEIAYDPELKTFTFVKTVYNPKERDLPPDGYVFRAE